MTIRTFIANPGAAASAVLLTSLLTLAGCNDNDTSTDMPVQIKVLSSAPQYVSGGDARIEVTADAARHSEIDLWLNGRNST